MISRKIVALAGLGIALVSVLAGCESADVTPEKSDSSSQESRVRPEQGDKLPPMKHGSYRETLLELDENSSADDGANFYQVLVTLEDGTQFNCISTQSGHNRAHGSALSCDWAGAKRPEKE